MQKDNNERLTKLELNMAEINLKLETKVEIYKDEKIQCSEERNGGFIVKDLSSKIDSRIKELEDRKQLSSNFMVYNLPESTSTSPVERNEPDERLL